MARSGLRKDTRYVGQIMAPWQRKLTTSPSGTSKDSFSARVAAVRDLEGVMSRLERYLDRLMAFDGADGLAVDREVEDAAPKLEGEGRFPGQTERCRH
jgi:hypothetical protein